MPKLTPRWYQLEACSAIIETLKTARRSCPVTAVVTGGGKSLIISMVLERLMQLWPASRIMVLAPSMTLVSQNLEEARGFLMPALAARIGVYCAGLRRRDRLAAITFGTPQSVSRQVRRFGSMDFVIVDEAHTFSPDTKTAKRIIDAFRQANENVSFVGLTGTDYRMSGQKVLPLTEFGLFTARVYDLTSGARFNRMVSEGYISPIVAPSVRFPQLDLSGIRTAGGDFDEKELAKRAMEVTSESVNVALDVGRDRRHFMWFAVNVAHAELIHTALSSAGETSVVIHGDLEKNEIVGGIDAYMSKQHRHIVSVAMLTTGFNAKFVDCIVILRATLSLPLFRQMIGRGFRPYSGKENCLVLDAGGNFSRHGPINAPVAEKDSRSRLWACSEEVMQVPEASGGLISGRERSSIRFPINSEAVETDLRIVLKLMSEDMPACGYLNEPEHLLCRHCGRPRQGYLQRRRNVDNRERPILSETDGYDIHDEDAIVLKDNHDKNTRRLKVDGMDIGVEGQSKLNIEFYTDEGIKTLNLDFDRADQDAKYFALARKFFEFSTGRKVPSEAYRVLLLHSLIQAPVDIVLTKYMESREYITEIRFIRDEDIKVFRYEPDF